MKHACWLIAVLTAASAAGTPAPKPRVNVVFAFDASMYANDQDLGDVGRKTVAEEAKDAFISEAGRTTHYPFIEWVKNDPTAANTLTIAITQRPVLRDQEVDIEYRGVAGGQAIKVGKSTLLFAWTDGKHTNAVSPLSSEIQLAIRNAIEDLRSEFVSRVPIASAVTPNNERELFVVPFPPSKLQADEERSTLLVGFKKKGSSTEPERTMKLWHPAPMGDEEIGWEIAHLEMRELTLPRPDRKWSPTLVTLFSPAAVTILYVGVGDYKYRSYDRIVK